MPSAIERYWPSKTGPGKLDSWVNHQKNIEVSEATLAEICGITKEEVKEYLDRLEAETSYRLKRDWVTRKNMTRKERIIGDRDIILIALAIGKCELKPGKMENELVLETTQGEMRVVTKISISPEELTDLLENFGRL